VGALTVYREARAQELTEILHTHPSSPWLNRINMLGDRGGGSVTQAAWVRALIGTFLSVGRGRAQRGLFQAKLPDSDDPLDWSRAQQAAFLIQLWVDVKRAIDVSRQQHYWIRVYKSDTDLAIRSKTSMLNQDMGIRALFMVANEIFYARSTEWKLAEWQIITSETASTDFRQIDDALTSLSHARFRARISELAVEIARFDWRSFDGPEVSIEQRQIKRTYRGSGGYGALRDDILAEIATGEAEIGRVAQALAAAKEA